jgi:hypothetical protein
MTYEIGVSFTGLRAITHALDGVASAFSAAAAQVAGEEPSGTDPAATELARELAHAASAALANGAGAVSSLAEQITRSSNAYQNNEHQITASELTRINDGPR